MLGSSLDYWYLSDFCSFLRPYQGIAYLKTGHDHFIFIVFYFSVIVLPSLITTCEKSQLNTPRITFLIYHFYTSYWYSLHSPLFLRLFRFLYVFPTFISVRFRSKMCSAFFFSAPNLLSFLGPLRAFTQLYSACSAPRKPSADCKPNKRAAWPHIYPSLLVVSASSSQYFLRLVFIPFQMQTKC